MPSKLRTRPLRSSGRGSSCWRLANASNCPVSRRARASASRIRAALRCRRVSVVSPHSTSSPPTSTVSRLFRSCATPPVSSPTACIFCAWRSAASASRRPVTSRWVPTKWRNPPSGPNTGLIDSAFQKALPSRR